MKVFKIEVRHSCFSNATNYLINNINAILLDVSKKLENGSQFVGEIVDEEKSIKYLGYDEADDVIVE